MIAGLSSQVASLFMFMVLCGDFARRVRRTTPDALNMDWSLSELRGSMRWKVFLLGMYGI